MNWASAAVIHAFMSLLAVRDAVAGRGADMVSRDARVLPLYPEAVVVAEFGPGLGELRARFLVEGIQPLGAL